MIAEAEAQELVTRLAASNVYIRSLIHSTLPVDEILAADRVCKANSAALKDFAAAHPETLGGLAIDTGIV